MKTFRLRGLRLLLEENEELEQEQVELQEGLVINREEEGWWLIEVVVDEPASRTFHQLLADQTEVMMEVLISHERNDPATMIGRVRFVRELSDRYSILIDGKMAMRKEDVFNYIIETLIADGYSGEELLEEFKNRKEDRASWSSLMARSLYNKYRQEGVSPLNDARSN
ncbi:hypothetical protein HNR44_000005 [Geomicrobium halophilum]|uniref:YwpF-like protein n=1 Tax=Geomicrobium halophilum TaxID=549000 RepID=A0A841PLG5_9BACL|nr:YwpF family protein [Geomicrobium halophilum]MBB6448056.1 hypothetical protein [Geomicrobium halophilum]